MSFMDFFTKAKDKADKKKKEVDGKKKSRYFEAEKTSGGQSKDASDTLKDLEKESKSYAYADDTDE